DIKVKISIIVPVFNAEMYIGRCIESLLKQTYTDFELILVNDGSIDNSRDICEAYAQKDKRIKVINNNK
ncbi:glycosyltransferase, partial [Leptospira santarosai]|nr:glycosyltransferase [Leptospira santarosai]